MWIIFRFALAAAAFGIQFVSKYSSLYSSNGKYKQIKYFQNISRNSKSKKINHFDIGFEVKLHIMFTFYLENENDHFFKRLGLSNEFQTGDIDFDRKIYIACDHPFLLDILKNNEVVRQSIKNLFLNGFTRIYSDGNVLWANKLIHREPNNNEKDLLFDLLNQFNALDSSIPNRFTDQFFWKAVVVQGLTWSIAASAIGSFFEYFFRLENGYLENFKLYQYGIIAAIALFIIFFGLTFLFLKGSSRGHKIIIESAILLLIGLPTLGFQVISDLNKSLDQSNPEIYLKKIITTEAHKHTYHRRGRTRTWYTYHIIIDNSKDNFIPHSFEVNFSTYQQASYAKQLEIDVAKGWLNIKWYKQLVVH